MANGDFKTFMSNAVKFLTFGMRLYNDGVCDEPIKGEFMLADRRRLYGYTKKEASMRLNLSERQFDRNIRKGAIRRGRKIRGETALYWDKDYIDKLSSQKEL